MAEDSAHTVKAFDDDLAHLRALVSEMGARAEAAVAGATQALSRRDVAGASTIVADDKAIDVLEVEVERLVVRLIALRAPMADDLRDVLAAFKISGVLERVGDYAKSIARRVPLLEHAEEIAPMAILPVMSRAVAEMVAGALDAFANRDADAAFKVCESDRQVDDLYTSLFRELLTHMMENPRTITAATHLLFIAKNLERIGDHATNIAEMVYFAATGERMNERVKGEGVAALDMG